MESDGEREETKAVQVVNEWRARDRCGRMESERSVEPAAGDAKTNVKRALWDDDGDWSIGEQWFHQQAKGLKYCNQRVRVTSRNVTNPRGGWWGH